MKNGSMMATVLCALTVIAPGAHRANAQVRSNSPAMNAIAQGQEMLHRNWQEYLASLTPRERALVHAIDAEESRHYRATQRSIAVTAENLRLLIRRVGARENEAAFVLKRMREHARNDQALADFDRQMKDFDESVYRNLGIRF